MPAHFLFLVCMSFFMFFSCESLSVYSSSNAKKRTHELLDLLYLNTETENWYAYKNNYGDFFTTETILFQVGYYKGESIGFIFLKMMMAMMFLYLWK